METGIEKRLIPKHRIKRNQYTLSLLQQAFRYGLTDRSAMLGIQSQIMLILKELITRFTRGESTSVKTETAESLLNSVYFTLDSYLCGIEDTGEALILLKTARTEDLYKKGIDLISECMAETKKLYKRLSGERLDFGTEAYESLFNDLTGFFGQYEIMFAAHETNADFDYPVLFDDHESRGIFYIRQYLWKLDLETAFIRLFREEEVLSLLRNHGRLNRIHYSKLMINMFELVLSQALYSVLSGTGVERLSLAHLQCELLERRLQRLSGSRVRQEIHNAFTTVISSLKITEGTLISYVMQYEASFLKSVFTALENHTLSRSVTVDSRESFINEAIALDGGKRLGAGEFRLLAAEIMSCENLKGKKELIEKRIRSWQDFIDILEADCLFENEYDAVYGSLGDVELAVLGNSAFECELRETNLEVFLTGNTESSREAEWQDRFIKYLCGLGSERISSVRRLMESIREGSLPES